jgi:hypothetical protein
MNVVEPLREPDSSKSMYLVLGSRKHGTRAFDSGGQPEHELEGGMLAAWGNPTCIERAAW